MNELVQAVKATGSIELLEFCSKDPKSKEELQKKDTWILTWSILDERAANCHGTGKYKSIQPSAFYITWLVKRSHL
jgi:hypothetical protein